MRISECSCKFVEMNKSRNLIFVTLFLRCAFSVSASCTKCFPPNFLWAAATSSYQIEGAWNASDKGENIWDWFTHTFPEKILDGSSGDVATDSYNKYEEDVEQLSELGVQFYRFSLSWSRILPDGTTKRISETGVNYYLNLVKKLKSKNIEPFVTIYHWDLPMPLQELGGWLMPEIVDYFLDYAVLCFELFGPYVKYWMTLNEPFIECSKAFVEGIYPPGYTDNGSSIYQCYYTHLLAHAKAYRRYNASYKATFNGLVGVNLVTHWIEPLTNSTQDIEAAENSLQWDVGLIAHPVCHGNWPQVVIDRVGNLSLAQGFNASRLPAFTNEEIELIKGTTDYIAVNYYTANYATPIADVKSIENTTVSYEVDKNVIYSVDSEWKQAHSSWLYNVPKGLRALLNWIVKNYGNRGVFITENGWSDESSTLQDPDRIVYIQEHLCNVLQAIVKDDVKVIGYTYWSLLNNFEWSSGYTEGFGLVHVDFSNANLTRTPKDSYYYYKSVINTNCLKHCPFK